MKTLEWGYLIVSYLFLGGLSAGLFFVSGLALLLQREANGGASRVARYGALLAPLPVLLGCLLLVFDLGRWYRFYKLFLHVEWTSPMSIGAWLLLIFSVIALLYACAWVPGDWRERAFAALPARLSFLRWANRDLARWQKPLALAGIPVAIGVGIYTGVLLGAVQSRPFWNTNLVAQMFLFSALSTGCAALILALAAGTAALVLAGGFLLRYVFVFAGQMSAFQ